MTSKLILAYFVIISSSHRCFSQSFWFVVVFASNHSFQIKFNFIYIVHFTIKKNNSLLAGRNLEEYQAYNEGPSFWKTAK